MKKTALERELKTLLRRVALIQSVAAGRVEFRSITVHRKKRSWTVHARQRSYIRRIAPTGWKP